MNLSKVSTSVSQATNNPVTSILKKAKISNIAKKTVPCQEFDRFIKAIGEKNNPTLVEIADNAKGKLNLPFYAGDIDVGDLIVGFMPKFVMPKTMLQPETIRHKLVVELEDDLIEKVTNVKTSIKDLADNIVASSRPLKYNPKDNVIGGITIKDVFLKAKNKLFEKQQDWSIDLINKARESLGISKPLNFMDMHNIKNKVFGYNRRR